MGQGSHRVNVRFPPRDLSVMKTLSPIGICYTISLAVSGAWNYGSGSTQPTCCELHPAKTHFPSFNLNDRRKDSDEPESQARS